MCWAHFTDLPNLQIVLLILKFSSCAVIIARLRAQSVDCPGNKNSFLKKNLISWVGQELRALSGWGGATRPDPSVYATDYWLVFVYSEVYFTYCHNHVFIWTQLGVFIECKNAMWLFKIRINIFLSLHSFKTSGSQLTQIRVTWGLTYFWVSMTRNPCKNDPEMSQTVGLPRQ